MENEDKLIIRRKSGSIAGDVESIWFPCLHMKLLLWDVLEKGRTQQTQVFPPLHDWSGSHSQSIRSFILMPGVQQRACSLFFFNVKGIVHRELVPPNTTVNSDFYCEVLRCLRDNVPQKVQNFGVTTTGSFIMTVRLSTRP
jgi:hypothetical protein